MTLERNINEFVSSTAQFISEQPNDIYAPFVACMPYVARILAHEALCTASMGDMSLILCTDAARRAIAGSVWQNGSTGTAIELLPFLTFVSASGPRERTTAVMLNTCDSVLDRGWASARSAVRCYDDQCCNRHGPVCTQERSGQAVGAFAIFQNCEHG